MCSIYGGLSSENCEMSRALLANVSKIKVLNLLNLINYCKCERLEIIVCFHRGITDF